MLKFIYKNSEIINPNEELRNEYRLLQQKLEFADLDVEKYFKKTIDKLEETEYNKFLLTISLIYKDVYMYTNVMKKSNEISPELRSIFRKKFTASNIDDIVASYRDDTDFYIDNFTYLLTLNNLYYLKMLLELTEEQNIYLQSISNNHIFDMEAIKADININTLFNFFDINYDENTTIEELSSEIKDFLIYVQFKNKNYYNKFIYDITKEIYGWCRYYIDNSINVQKEDFEVKIIRFIEELNNSIISTYLSIDQAFLTQVLTYILKRYADNYQIVSTRNGKEKITKDKIKEYLKSYKKIVI